jgi:hypothetical protein
LIHIERCGWGAKLIRVKTGLLHLDRLTVFKYYRTRLFWGIRVSLGNHATCTSHSPPASEAHSHLESTRILFLVPFFFTIPTYNQVTCRLRTVGLLTLQFGAVQVGAPGACSASAVPLISLTSWDLLGSAAPNLFLSLFISSTCCHFRVGSSST